MKPYELIFTENYTKKAKRFILKHPQIRLQYQKTLELLTLNPKHNSLRLHPLSGKLKGLHSVSINMQYRITLEIIIRKHEIILIDIGDHGLYR